MSDKWATDLLDELERKTAQEKGDDLSAFREEMRRRGVYERNLPGGRTLAQKAARGVRKVVAGFASDVLGECLENLDTVTVKRLAWAFGCAKAGSEVESALYRALVRKVEKILADRRGATP